MAGNLPEPFLISTVLKLDHLEIGGRLVEFKHVFYSWVALLALCGLGLWLRKRLTIVPGRVQNVVETVIDGLEQFTVTTAGEDGRKFFPLLCGIFIFILIQNLFGLLPGFDAPTANINTNLAMAVFVFVYYNYMGIKRWKFGYIKQFMGPMPALAPLMLPLEIISHTARPLSLTLRLFGNIRAEELVLVIFFFLAPVLSTFPVYFLFLLAKVLQAFIFFMLTMIYIKGSQEEAH